MMISKTQHILEKIYGKKQKNMFSSHDYEVIIRATQAPKDAYEKAKEYEAPPYPGPSKEKCALDRTGAGEGAF